MTFPYPTISAILYQAWAMARKRSELLILLALLSGILCCIVYMPASAVLNNIFEALEEPMMSDEERTNAAMLALNDGVGTLFMGQLAIMAITAFLLVPWARAVAPTGLIPADGGFPAFARRGIRSFIHLLVALGLTILAFVTIMPFTALLSTALGSLGTVLTIISATALIWLSLSFSGAANFAVASEAQDQKQALFSAWTRVKSFLKPVTGSLALIFLLMVIINALIGNLIIAVLPESFGAIISMVLSGTMIYLVSALHIAGLRIIPSGLRPVSE